MDSLLPSDITAGEIIYPPGGTHGPRIQTSIQLVLLYSGEMSVWIDGERRDAAANTVTLLLPGHREHFVFARNTSTHHAWVHLWFEDAQPLIERLTTLPQTLPLAPEMVALMQSLLTIQASLLSTRMNTLRLSGMAMLWQYIGAAEIMLNGKRDTPGHRMIEQARQYILQHLGEPLTSNQIAAHVSLSTSQLTRLFKTHLSTTPAAYLWSVRVSKGIELLTHTGLSVQVIAEQCGFQNSYHFSRRIKEATGSSPRALRQRLWQG
jgi:AraC-like DNA-binding protein